MKKLTAVLVLAALIISFSPSAAAWGEDSDDFFMLTGSHGGEESAQTSQTFDFLSKSSAEIPSLDMTAAILLERETGEVIYEYKANEPRAIASITKIMTMILVMEALECGEISLEDEVTTSEHAYSMGGSQIWLEPGEVMTVDELLRAVAVASANDAAVALAEFVSGSEEAFVADMNRRAAELGMTSTTFKNANGLDEDGHMSCARDVAIMSREVLRHELVRNYITVWTDELRGGETQLTNTNKMLRTFEGMTGIKTGTTNRAGVCLSGAAERDGMELIAVVLGSSNSKGRFDAVRTLLEYGFSHCELADIEVDPSALTDVAVRLGEEESCPYIYDVPERLLVERGKREAVVCETELEGTVEAPVEQGQQLGCIRVYVEGSEVGSYPITASQRIEKLSFGTAYQMLVSALLEMQSDT